MTPRRHPFASRSLITTLVAVLTLAVARPAWAAPPDPPPPPPVVEPAAPPTPFVPSPPPGPPAQSLLPPSPPPLIAPELADVVLTGPDYARAEERLADSRRREAMAGAAKIDAEVRLLGQIEEETRLTGVIAEATDRRRRHESHLGAVEHAVERLAVEHYINGGGESSDVPMLELDASGANDAEREHVLVSAVNDDLVGEMRRTRRDLEKARGDVSTNITARKALRGEIAETETAIVRAGAERKRFAGLVLVRTGEVDATRPLALVQGTNLPLVVLDAYAKAAQRLAEDVPECGISWWGLAGIGFIESGHGTHGGSEVRANGDLSKPIIGIQLNGSNLTAFITDTDGGFYDGDTGFDRAVGPMQFIPPTWEPWKRDGNEDGRFDPQNLYDSAYAAAAYTCAGGPMRSDDDLRRGYFSYNHDAAYVELVLSRAKQYASAVALPAP